MDLQNSNIPHLPRMKKGDMKFGSLLIVAGLVCSQNLRADERIHCAVTYVSSSLAYLDAGRDAGFAVGDSVEIFHANKSTGIYYITSVSKKSAAATLNSTATIAVGDSGISTKTVSANPRPPITLVHASPETVQTNVASPIRMDSPPATRNNQNVVSGRAAIQYSGLSAGDRRLNLSQPAPLLHLSVSNIAGSGAVFTAYTRSYYDLAELHGQSTNRLKVHLYELQLQYDLPGADYGYSVGRITSRFVGGMGMFDGGQMFARSGSFTGGVVYGSNLADQTVSINREHTEGGLFLNYHGGKDFLHYFDGTVAYVRQQMKNRLDREFFYLQNSFATGPDFSLYESSELELNDITNGVRSRALKLSNTFLSANYVPLQWLMLNAGYDGTRGVYLFESMKSFSDTLIDKNFMQGYRVNATARLPYSLSLGGGIIYRTKKGDARDGKTISGSLRSFNLFGSEVGGEIRYAAISGTYSDGRNITVDMDKMFFYTFTVSVRYDYYRYNILSLNQSFLTQTISANFNYSISRSLYAAFSADGVRESAVNSLRVFAELGIRF